MHARSRVRRFLFNIVYDKKEQRKDVFRTIEYLFSERGGSPDPCLISAMTQYLGYVDDNERMSDIQKNCYRHIRLFYKLQRFNEDNKLNNFALIPIMKHGLHHVRYDSQGLWCRLGALKLANEERTDAFNAQIFQTSQSKKQVV